MAVHRRTARVMPVLSLGVVQAELHPMLPAGLRHSRDHVAPEWCRICDVVRAGSGLEHREPVVVLARDDDIFHARCLREGYPFIRIELYRIELLCVGGVPGYRDLSE